jgi:hypothetical protein
MQTKPTAEQQALIEKAKENNNINKALLKEVDKTK